MWVARWPARGVLRECGGKAPMLLLPDRPIRPRGVAVVRITRLARAPRI